MFFTYGDEIEPGFYKMLESYGYEIHKKGIELPNGEKLERENLVVHRFFDFEKYLEEHINEYDRVAFTDVRDVYWFADGFSTIDPNELIFMAECEDHEETKEMICTRSGYTKKISGSTDIWISRFFDKNTTEFIKKKHGVVLNGGFVAGSPKKMLEFLKIMNRVMREHIGNHKNLWGLDQATLNVIYHSGMLNHLNVTVDTYTQRIGTNMHHCFNYDKQNKIIFMISKKCSPVIRHKICPANKPFC